MSITISSPARDTLARVNAEVIEAEGRVDELTARIGQLNRVIAARAPAEERLLAAVEAGGLDVDARTKRDGTELDAAFDEANHATQIAAVAAQAMPRVKVALEEAHKTVARLHGQKREAVAAVLIEHADGIAKEYREAFERLGALHDQLRGFAGGLAMVGVRGQITLADGPIEVPRFNLPSLPVKDGFTPYLTHVPHGRRVVAASVACRQAATRLMEDGTADVAELLTPAAIEAAIDPRRPFETEARPVISIRQRAPEPTVNEIIFGDRAYATPRNDRAAG